jgi:hypothetical protein
MAAALLLLALLPPLARGGHGTFPLSTAIYRIPYADGTTLIVSRDHHNHGGAPGLNNQGNNRIDMVADTPPVNVVAAASGVVMAIVDIHGNSNGLGDGLDINGQAGQILLDGVTVHTDLVEHSCQDANEDTDGDGALDPGEDLNGNGLLETSVPNSAAIGLCQSYNNYVWIRHPNGEWSKYTHMATGSITGPPGNLSVGDTVMVGQVLGVEADIGRASGRHLHHEVATPTNMTDPTPFGNGSFIPGAIPGGGNLDQTGTIAGYYAGGFIQGTNLVPIVCDIPNNLYVDGSTSPGNNAFTANPCINTAPTADTGGPYEVNEGDAIQLDGTGSSDPENAILTYTWSPDDNLDDPTLATPTYTAIDDSVVNLTLTVSDIGGDVTAAAALTDDDSTTLTVINVPPTVTAVGDSIQEGGTATVSATFTDPGVLDTHTATIAWADGTPPQAVTIAQLAGGVSHVYGDNGSYHVVVTVTDDDGGVGMDVPVVMVTNIAPTATLDVSGEISFPGGDFQVVEAGTELPSSAEGTDPGSDDLTFTWSVGPVNTHFNDGVGPDPFPSPLGTFPFLAGDAIEALYAGPGVHLLSVTLTDDDGGSDESGGNVIVTGTAETTEGPGWWQHQYSGTGAAHVDADTLDAYRAIVNAVSSVFSEDISAASAAEVHSIMTPTGGNPKARAAAELMVAWLQFASGAVDWDANVPVGGGQTMPFLDVMFHAEEVILDGSASSGELLDVRRLLMHVRNAE